MTETDPIAANGYPESISGSGMGVREMLAAARRWSRRQKGEQPHFGWLTLKQKQRAQEKKRRLEARLKPAGDRPPAVKRRIDLQAAWQHRAESGVKKFRVATSDPWTRL